ncbi:MAG TPA: riboflavin synthase, partial [Candidatus Binataceae bacterium]|nr:riboflavin synthase [Candidatus Binataceae bacterium]
ADDIMFSGIIEDLGKVADVKHGGEGAVLTIRTGMPIAKIKIGDSIAVNGACLTVTAKGRGSFKMDVSAETLRRTSLGELKVGHPVNLERCLTLNTLLNGHIVAGHVDSVGRVVSIKPEGDSKLFTFEVAANEARYLVEKGSVAIDGISLTVFGIRGRRFNCALIPHTLKVTTMGVRKPGDKVNVESDMMAKYVERILSGREAQAANAP